MMFLRFCVMCRGMGVYDRWDRIKSSRIAGMTAQDAPDGKPQAFAGSMTFDSLNGIG